MEIEKINSFGVIAICDVGFRDSSHAWMCLGSCGFQQISCRNAGDEDIAFACLGLCPRRRTAAQNSALPIQSSRCCMLKCRDSSDKTLALITERLRDTHFPVDWLLKSFSRRSDGSKIARKVEDSHDIDIAAFSGELD